MTPRAALALIALSLAGIGALRFERGADVSGAGLAAGGEGAGLRLVRDDDPAAVAEREAAARWIEAIRTADSEAIVGLVLPESRDETRRALESHDSELSKRLLHDPDSARKRFAGLEVRFALLVGRETEACYYAGPAPRWPANDGELAALVRSQRALCFRMSQAGGRWCFAALPEGTRSEHGPE
jgi:hypothetical protein